MPHVNNYSNGNSVPTYTTPASVAGMTMWLDFSDSTVTKGTGNILTSTCLITSVRDKSTNAYLATAATTSTAPSSIPNSAGTSGNLPLAYFPVTGKQMAITFPGNSYAAQGTHFAVIAYSGSTFSSYTGGGAGNLTAGVNWLLDFSSLGSLGYPYTNNYYAIAALGPTTMANLYWLTSMNDTYADAPVIARNTIHTSGDMSPINNLFVYVGSAIQISKAFSFGTNWTGYLGELIIYSGTLTSTQIAGVTAYLMNKWGITQPSFIPTQVPGCSLWLDAADTSSMVTTTSNLITSWKDKSGSNRTFVQPVTASAPTFTSATSGNCVTFTTTTSLRITSSVTVSSTTCFMVFKTTAGGPSNNTNGTTGDDIFILNGSNSTIIFDPTGNYLKISSGGTAANIQVNGVSKTSTTAINPGTTPIEWQCTGLGSGSPGTIYVGFGRYSLCELLIYSGSLTTNQTNNISQYLRNKWGTG
jgi:hypothetical protein